MHEKTGMHLAILKLPLPPWASSFSRFYSENLSDLRRSIVRFIHAALCVPTTLRNSHWDTVDPIHEMAIFYFGINVNPMGRSSRIFRPKPQCFFLAGSLMLFGQNPRIFEGDVLKLQSVQHNCEWCSSRSFPGVRVFENVLLFRI